MLRRLAIGTAQFGLHYGIANQSERVSMSEAARIVAAARTAGVDTLDTAIAYGDSEQVLGKLGVAGWRVVSKLPALPDECVDIAGWVETQLTGSLGRLRIDQLDAVLLHRPAQLLGSRGAHLLAGLLAVKRQGLVRKIGVSIYDPEELDALFALHHFDIVQAPCSILDQRILASGAAAWLQARDVELQTRSTFLQGLLLMPPEARPSKFARWAEVWTEWDGWLAANGLTSLEACLRFVNNATGVSKAVIGFDTADHFAQACTVVGKPLESLPQWPTLDRALLNPFYWSQL